MLRPILAALAVALYSSTVLGQVSYYSHLPDGKIYRSSFSRAEIAASPKWLGKDDNPPLSARKALKLAQSTFDKTALPKYGDLVVQLWEATLMWLGDDKWVWRVRYHWHVPKGFSSGPGSDFYVLILMDGTVASPRKPKDGEH